MINKISVIGGGAWGTTIANLLASKGYNVTIWVFEQDVSDSINKIKINNVYLPDVVLSANLSATTNIDNVIEDTDCMISVLPTQHIRQVFGNIKFNLKKESLIVSASKGIENNTFKTPSQILKELLCKDISVLSGPSFAEEVAMKLPTAITIASVTDKNNSILQGMFNTDYFRVYIHKDLIGSEIGGAIKNVVAIASGICDGLGLGNNARAGLITRGLAEITRLGVYIGADAITFSGLSGIGDLFLTCTSNLSRNYTVGYKIGHGKTLTNIVKETRSIAEGVSTALSVYKFSKMNKIEMPITEQVYLTLYQDKSPMEAVKDLMHRSLKAEFYE